MATPHLPDVATCVTCPRLVAERRGNRLRYPEYHNAPVGGWGSPDAQCLIVGLAPGLHGANRTGVPFTGDASGRVLFDALRGSGFATPEDPNGGAAVFVTNAVKCWPPGNRPTAAEMNACRDHLKQELACFRRGKPVAVVCLGGDAYRSFVRALDLPRNPFGHGREGDVDEGLRWFASYHPSRLNLNTGRVTANQVRTVFCRAHRFIS